MSIAKMVGQAFLGIAILIALPFTTDYLSRYILNTQPQQTALTEYRRREQQKLAPLPSEELTQLYTTDRINQVHYNDRMARTKLLLGSAAGLLAIATGTLLTGLPIISAGLILGGWLGLSRQHLSLLAPWYVTIFFSLLLLALSWLIFMSFKLARRKVHENFKLAAIGWSVMLLVPVLAEVAPRLIKPRPEAMLHPTELSAEASAAQLYDDGIYLAAHPTEPNSPAQSAWVKYLAQQQQIQKYVSILLGLAAVIAGLGFAPAPYLGIGLVLGGVKCLGGEQLTTLAEELYNKYLFSHPYLTVFLAFSTLILLFSLFISLFRRFRIINLRKHK